jgi:hypothetical protein
MIRRGSLPEGALAESGIDHAAALPVSPSQTSAWGPPPPTPLTRVDLYAVAA